MVGICSLSHTFFNVYCSDNNSNMTQNNSLDNILTIIEALKRPIINATRSEKDIDYSVYMKYWDDYYANINSRNMPILPEFQNQNTKQTIVSNEFDNSRTNSFDFENPKREFPIVLLNISLEMLETITPKSENLFNKSVNFINNINSITNNSIVKFKTLNFREFSNTNVYHARFKYLIIFNNQEFFQKALSNEIFIGNYNLNFIPYDPNAYFEKSVFIDFANMKNQDKRQDNKQDIECYAILSGINLHMLETYTDRLENLLKKSINFINILNNKHNNIIKSFKTLNYKEFIQQDVHKAEFLYLISFFEKDDCARIINDGLQFDSFRLHFEACRDPSIIMDQQGIYFTEYDPEFTYGTSSKSKYHNTKKSSNNNIGFGRIAKPQSKYKIANSFKRQFTQL